MASNCNVTKCRGRRNDDGPETDWAKKKKKEPSASIGTLPNPLPRVRRGLFILAMGKQRNSQHSANRNIVPRFSLKYNPSRCGQVRCLRRAPPEEQFVDSVSCQRPRNDPSTSLSTTLLYEPIQKDPRMPVWVFWSQTITDWSPKCYFCFAFCPTCFLLASGWITVV